MPRGKGTSKRFFCNEELANSQKDLKSAFVFSMTNGPQLSHIRNFQSWLFKTRSLSVDVIDQMNKPPDFQVQTKINEQHPFVTIQMLEVFAIYLIEEEERKRIRIIIDGKKKCISEWCHTFVNDNYTQYCSCCYIYLFPD